MAAKPIGMRKVKGGRNRKAVENLSRKRGIQVVRDSPDCCQSCSCTPTAAAQPTWAGSTGTAG